MLVAVAAAAAAGCTGDEPDGLPTGSSAPDGTATRPHDPGTDVTTNPAASQSGPAIQSFDAPAAVSCDGATPAAVQVTWSAPTASVVRFSVDGDGLAGDHPPEGVTTIELPCDDAVHVVLLAAVGDDGTTRLDSAAVLAEPT